MSMTSFERGDVVLISFPVNDLLEMHLRPVMVVHAVHGNDAAIAIAPISPEPSERYQSIHIAHGSYEAARLGLVTSGYLIACGELIVERQFVVRRLGRCPWQLLNEFMTMMKNPIVKRPAASQVQSSPIPENLAGEAF